MKTTSFCTLALAITAAGVSNALVIDDFSTPNRSNTGGNVAITGIFDPVTQTGGGWASKGQTAGNNDGEFIVQGGVLDQVAKSGSETRAAIVVDISSLTGTGWSFEFDLLAGEADNIDLWLGKDDGDNAGDTNSFTLGGDGPPPASWVNSNSAPFDAWSQVVDLDDFDTVGTYSEDLSSIDMSDYDYAAIKIGQRASGQFVEIDNVEFVPEPGSLALFGLGGIIMLRRRR